MKSSRRALAWGGLTAGVAVLSYPLFFRHKCLTWGARQDEVSLKLPGDELLPDAGLITTRAVTIAAPPDRVWPWLVQMGSGRGGAYTYDWIENLLGLDMHSADEVVPELQLLQLGDELPMGGDRLPMRVAILDAERTFAIQHTGGGWVWIFALIPEDGATRLISRNRIRATGLTPEARLAYRLVMEPGSLIMERKMLLGIKARAERLARDQAAAASLGTSVRDLRPAAE
ncbi:MAG TPA: hypothetical protein VKU39_11455 [Streptosporangiaceae bacterium]|nr:hypothetical protein [Streptosporangiaceae bacterium]